MTGGGEGGRRGEGGERGGERGERDGRGREDKTRVKPDAIHSNVKVEVFNFTSSGLS